MLPDTLAGFFIWLGSNIAFGLVSSWIAANVQLFQNLSSGLKTAVLLAVAIGMGLVSRAATVYIPAVVIDQLQPWYAVVVGAVVIVLGQQFWYAKVERPRQVAPPKPGKFG